jgi:hypothetical protein
MIVEVFQPINIVGVGSAPLRVHATTKRIVVAAAFPIIRLGFATLRMP